MFASARELFTPQELAEFDEQYEEWKTSFVAAGVTAHARIKTGLKSVMRNPKAPG
ncbi:hypothetical protein ACW5F0_07655 [Luteimonas sp. A534]